MGTRVYVGGLPRDATSREIQDGFSRYGHVSNIWVARNPPGFAFVRTEYRVRVTDLPRDVDWRNVKDFLRTGGEVTYCNIEADGSAIAEFQTKEDMEDAVKKLDDTEFRGSYVRVAPEGDSSRRSRSRSPARGRSPSRRSRSRSPAARKDSRAVRAPDQPRRLLVARPLARTRLKLVSKEGSRPAKVSTESQEDLCFLTCAMVDRLNIFCCPTSKEQAH
ncbi:hypothetical protein AM588_10005161 [Phytophthora nicotianae]|uniref:RRM domain-containing protein n=1 Tax=Phytophthora nicotianae TaxID=4792 RepID=A0A0W8DFV2_PHYNI|nr:hypothetical protein AM588_10005161 [Phytophthora nicotianae]